MTVAVTVLAALGAFARMEEAPQAEKSRCVTWERLQELDPGLLQLGELAVRTSKEIESSTWGVGCETMDRDYATFKNFKAFIAETGAKHARLQSGWDKTERVKGEYDFAWLDEHVYGLAECGVKPWMCICYGSRHYGLTAEMGWPVAKITENPEAFAAWKRYVRALVTRYRDVIDEWEVWNEPFGKQADVYSKLVIATADVVREVQPRAKVYVSAPGAFENYPAILENLKAADRLNCVTAWIYHPYIKNPDANDPWWGFDTVAKLQALLKSYNPSYYVIQGEVGCPAQLEYSHALNNYPWTEYSQAKWNLRRMAGEHVRGIPYGIFSMVDFEYRKFMLQSFGLLRMDLAQEVVYRRPTFYACRNMMSFFDSEVLPVGLVGTSSKRMTAAKFRKNGTDVLLVWRSDEIPGDSLSFDTIELAVKDVVFRDPVWVELITGQVYALGPDDWTVRGGNTFFRRLRTWDSPVMIAERDQVPLRHGLWTREQNAEIDARIEKHRKTEYTAGGFPAGAKVSVRQVSSEFLFGMNLFNFDQLGDARENEAYKAAFTNLFNAATVPFYWKQFEPEEGKPRYKAGARDESAFWIGVRSRGEDPYAYCEWRRPSPERLLAFCREHGLAVHGHVMIYPSYQPDWLDRSAPDEPSLWTAYRRRIDSLAEHYGSSVPQWDIVNESVNRRSTPATVNDDVYWNDEKYRIPKDMTYRCFKEAEKVLPRGVRLLINDSYRDIYPPFIAKLIKRGVRIDEIGLQMHIFSPYQLLKVAKGETCYPNWTSWKYEYQVKMLESLSVFGRPIHLSEITVPSPRGLVGTDEEADAIQASVLRDCYRLWFSWPQVNRITYWNMVDDLGAKSERMSSGIFNRDMTPKAAARMLDRLINREWRTELEVTADGDGKVAFRGFRGRYELVWTDAEGRPVRKEAEL